MRGAAFARRYAADHLRTVAITPVRVESPTATGEATAE